MNRTVHKEQCKYITCNNWAKNWLPQRLTVWKRMFSFHYLHHVTYSWAQTLAQKFVWYPEKFFTRIGTKKVFHKYMWMKEPGSADNIEKCFNCFVYLYRKPFTAPLLSRSCCISDFASNWSVSFFLSLQVI